MEAFEEILQELGIVLEIDAEDRTITIHAPAQVRVRQRSTNDYTEGTSVILELRE
ncbi:hypothetical protein SEA_STROSAHL_68 [Gordonia phage Strosahl]|uniref:Uncharacterized protein n=2 Tax=Soupsvirus strosahl TaxID=2560510 RepID=A0A1B3B1G3_9CAUD|nr:hypothetical protein BIZ67_gp042 [Gordonia phage Remus]YP_009596269.1 hypothetical protein FDH03_gp042 [Gordonia phage Strosahl]AOE44676.1 hypothetical protein SEA_REMUS_68 [Gordonia phage Remus]AOE44778.1 hypothetical protein SEA_STROSAHL_68 [Gordonia phage Strosahl]